MFTIENYTLAASKVVRNRATVYDPCTNELSYRLSGLSSNDRGAVVEYMLVAKMESFGMNVTHLGGVSSHDIMIDNGIRGEVKSSLLGPVSSKYYFQGVKPECFDIVFFSFVHPVMGLVVKTTSAKNVSAWAKKYNVVRKAEGYDIYFPATMINPKLETVEWKND